MSLFSIAGRRIAHDAPPYVIAEMSGNHNGDINRAIRLVEAAHEAGADAVKLQTYTADTLTIDCDKSDFRIQGGLWDGETLYSLYQKAYTPWEWHEPLFQRASQLGITMFSTPFDETAVDFLEGLGCPAYKIASFECVDHELIAKAGATGKPLIFSTGMATVDEIQQALLAAQQSGAQQVLPLYCVSAYPLRLEDANLRCLPELAKLAGGMAGLSDHSPGITVPVVAVALGAVAIEKHLTLSRDEGGPDAAFSLEPQEFKQLADAARGAWQALGQAGLGPKPNEKPSLVFRRSLYVVRDVKKGEAFTRENVRSIRPGHGMPPRAFGDVLGRKAVRDIERGTPLSFSLLEVEH